MKAKGIPPVSKLLTVCETQKREKIDIHKKEIIKKCLDQACLTLSTISLTDDDKLQAMIELLQEPNSIFFKKNKADERNLEPMKDKI